MTPQHTDPHLQLLDDARHAQAVADRSQRRLLEQADEQDATFRGSLEDAAETATAIVLETTVGRRVSGVVRALAADHAVIEGEHGTAWVRLSAVTVLRLPRQRDVRAGGADRSDRAAVPFAGALRALVESRADVDVVLVGGATTRGAAVAAGRDVLTLRDPVTGDHVLVHLDSVALVETHT